LKSNIISTNHSLVRVKINSVIFLLRLVNILIINCNDKDKLDGFNGCNV
jgi:hypothetical protein